MLSLLRWWVGSPLSPVPCPPEPGQGTGRPGTRPGQARGRTRHQGKRDRGTRQAQGDPPGAGVLIYILPASDFIIKTQVRTPFHPCFRLTQGIPETLTRVFGTGAGPPSPATGRSRTDRMPSWNPGQGGQEGAEKGPVFQDRRGTSGQVRAWQMGQGFLILSHNKHTTTPV